MKQTHFCIKIFFDDTKIMKPGKPGLKTIIYKKACWLYQCKASTVSVKSIPLTNVRKNFKN